MRRILIVSFMTPRMYWFQHFSPENKGRMLLLSRCFPGRLVLNGQDVFFTSRG